MAAYNTHKTVFSDVSYLDTTQAKSSWSFDSPKGLADSSAIGNWKSEHPVYIVRLNETGTKLRKIQITNEDAFQYTILVGDINSSIPVSLTIIKNPDCNFTYFSFDLLTTVNDIEPNKNAWDLQVTRYNYSFFDQTPVLRYVVNGFLLNPTKTSAYKDSLTSYNNIDTHFADSVSLSSYRDAIGFDWKSYNIDKGLYTIVAKYNYVIKNQNDHVFKLHFLDYYSSTGIKGSPKFEFYQLK
jgi:hypothetical protein